MVCIALQSSITIRIVLSPCVSRALLQRSFHFIAVYAKSGKLATIWAVRRSFTDVSIAHCCYPTRRKMLSNASTLTSPRRFQEKARRTGVHCQWAGLLRPDFYLLSSHCLFPTKINAHFRSA